MCREGVLPCRWTTRWPPNQSPISTSTSSSTSLISSLTISSASCLSFTGGTSETLSLPKGHPPPVPFSYTPSWLSLLIPTPTRTSGLAVPSGTGKPRWHTKPPATSQSTHSRPYKQPHVSSSTPSPWETIRTACWYSARRGGRLSLSAFITWIPQPGPCCWARRCRILDTGERRSGGGAPSGLCSF